MKKIKFNLPAFSLAEALITLLIVCLITLASIPVLTKKKRSVNKLASGKWMCTLNSKGEYVTYSSSDPQGDIKDPNTWRVSNQTNCTFIPPQNAKNFGVTIIGGGGGGHDGENEMKTYLDEYKSNYTVAETGRFHLAVIGNGGGGTGSDDSDGDPNTGVGGQGGGGAYWVGEIKLNEGWTVSRSVSTADLGGATDDGSEAGWPGVTADKHFNVFWIEGNEYMKAGNGSAGQATQNTGGADPKGGNGGNGGSLIINTAPYGDLTVKKDQYTTNNTGIAGRTNANCKSEYSNLLGCTGAWYFGNTYGSDRRAQSFYGTPCYGKTNGIKLSEYFNNDNYEYGLGGFGCKAQQKTGMDANHGTVKLWQLVKRPGGGGGAAKLTYHYFPNIEGKLVATIGKGGNANQAGERTRVQVYNLNGIVDRTIYGDGGAGGVQGNIVYEDTEAKGEVGQDSLWLGQGGGSVGTCREAGSSYKTKTVSEDRVETDANGDPICLIAAYFVGPVDTQTNSTDEMATCPCSESSKPPCVCVTCSVTKNLGKCKFKEVQTEDGTTNITYNDSIAQIYMARISNSYKHKFGTYTDLKTYFGDRYLSDSWNVTKSEKLTGYKFIKDETNICLAYKTKTLEYETYELVYSSNASCDDSFPGTYFGAGGGGGSAAKQVGVFGKGGKGAPGAVIVEW